MIVKFSGGSSVLFLVGTVGSDVGQINEVALRWARLVLGWVTVQLLGQLSLAILSWVGAMSTGQRVAMLCGWGVKARMARV